MNHARTESAFSVSHPSASRKDFARALTDAFPLSISVFTYGIAYGALANTSGHLSLLQTMSMSIFVFAGASQFTVLALIQQGAAATAIIGSAFLLNARQILYGVSLGPYVKHIPSRQLAFLAHGLTDESYSVSIVAGGQRPLTAWYLAGAGSAIFFPWQLASVIGYVIGGFITHPETFGLDFAYIGAFLGLLVAQLGSKSKLWTALSATVTAVLSYQLFGTTGAIVAGALTAFVIGYAMPVAKTDDTDALNDRALSDEHPSEVSAT